MENLPFESVNYWSELCSVMEWSKTNVFSVFYICWGAQAGLYYHYGVPKHPLPDKMFGVFPHYRVVEHHPLLRGFDDIFMVPHSRHTETRAEDIAKVPQLQILTQSDISGTHIIASRDDRRFFVTGHGEYALDTLASEYHRDVSAGLPIAPPINYFAEDDPSKKPVFTWKSHAHLLFANWLNYCVYQRRPTTCRVHRSPNKEEHLRCGGREICFLQTKDATLYRMRPLCISPLGIFEQYLILRHRPLRWPSHKGCR